MLMNIHSCYGKYDIKISSRIANYDDNQNDIYYKETKDELIKKYMYYIPNLTHRHIYVSIKPKISQECNNTNKIINYYNYYDDFMRYNCSDKLSYLINYYSGTQINIMGSEIKASLRYRRENRMIWIKIPSLENYEYNIFWTKNQEQFYKMDCICYLNELANDIKKGLNDEINFRQNIQLKENTEFPIEEKNKKQIIFVMVVSRNIKTNELSTFNPLIVKSKKSINPIYVFIYIGVIILLYLFVRRLNRKNKFDFHKSDENEIPSEIEMSSHRNIRSGYSTLRRTDF